ncbi:hypothetical protein [Rhizobium alvei]|uniref:Transmembrane protein n=1 Tax=Rhizobium alvei TaxID=1132659 RepID=A0ABT8YP71_9HYPH|nr:hypothetical protein [Rhizobium alvei]MDO6965462.1 hypothetical protein [Rhizobium alvei]
MKMIIILTLTALSLTSCVVAATDGPRRSTLIVRPAVTAVVVVPRRHYNRRHCYIGRNKVQRCYYR